MPHKIIAPSLWLHLLSRTSSSKQSDCSGISRVLLEAPRKKNQNKIRLYVRTFTICHKCLNVSKTTNNPHSVIHVRIRQHVTLQDETDVGQNGTSITTALTCTDLLCNTFLSAHFIYSTVNINSCPAY